MSAYFIQASFADANCVIADKSVFDNAISSVEKFLSLHFDSDWRVNVIVTTSLSWLLIAEDNVGGKTYASDFVVLAINEKTKCLEFAEMLSHEIAHAIRWGKNSEWSRNLFCELISEGLAVHIEAAFAATQAEKTFFLKTILGHNKEYNHELCEKLKARFDASNYNYDEVFFGSGELPRWAGYSAGYYLVERFLEQVHQSIFDVIGEPYDTFYKVLSKGF